MTTPDNKLQEFKQSGLSLVSRELVSIFGPMATASTNTEKDLERLVQDMPNQLARSLEREAILSGGALEGVMLRGGQFEKYNASIRDRNSAHGKKDGGMDIAFLQLLSDIDALDQKIDAARQDIMAWEAQFEAQYGPEWRETLGEMYLSDDEMAALDGLEGPERDQAIVNKLQDKMLDADGNIKPEWEHHDVAKYVHSIQKEIGLTAERDELVIEVEKALEDGTISLEQKDGSLDAITAKREQQGLSGEFAAKASPQAEDKNAKLEAMREDQDVNTSSDVAEQKFTNMFGGQPA